MILKYSFGLEEKTMKLWMLHRPWYASKNLNFDHQLKKHHGSGVNGSSALGTLHHPR